MQLSRENNFDLIRLVAALQVVCWHSVEHLHFQSQGITLFEQIISYFPGVIIFFTVSGFLIYASFDRNTDLKSYMRARFLRIYPALWACLLVTITLLIFFGFIASSNFHSKAFIIWLITQISFLQYYTPSMLRGFGVGSPNGSLWTIPIEITFYIAIPLIFYSAKRLKVNKTVILSVLAALSFVYNYWYNTHHLIDSEGSAMGKIMKFNLIPYLFYFLLGSLTYVNWQNIKKWYIGKGLIWLSVYIAYCLIFSVWLKKFTPDYWPNFYALVSALLLTQTVIALAYTAKDLAKIVLRKNDISYGVYLYHMLIINVFVQFGYKGDVTTLVSVIAVTILMALLSWWIIERPALKLKKRTIGKEKQEYVN